MTLDQALFAAVVALAGVISYLFKLSMDRIRVAEARSEEQIKQSKESLEKCYAQHEATNQTILQLTANVSRLEGEQAGTRNLAEQVLTVVAECKNCTFSLPPKKTHG